jgi:hypothetical protein
MTNVPGPFSGAKSIKLEANVLKSPLVQKRIGEQNTAALLDNITYTQSNYEIETKRQMKKYSSTGWNAPSKWNICINVALYSKYVILDAARFHLLKIFIVVVALRYK